MALIYVLTMIVALLIILLYRYFCGNHHYWKKKGVPVPQGNVPFCGHDWSAFCLKKDLGSLYKDIHHSCTGHSMVGIFTMRIPVLLIRDPELIKTVLHTEFNNFRHHHFGDSKVDPLLSQSPFLLNNQEWKDTRGIFTNAFTTRRLKASSSVAEKSCLKLVDHLNKQMKKDNFVDIEGKDTFQRVITEIVAGTVLSLEGESFDQDSPQVFRVMLKDTFKPSILQAMKFTIFFLIPGLHKFIGRFIPRWVNQCFSNIIDKLIKEREIKATKMDDIFQHIIDYCRGKNLSRLVITSNAFLFFLEGYHTSSQVLSFLACSLAQYPEVQKKLREEVVSVLNKHGGKISYEAISDMTYLDQVVLESMRLNPIGITLRKFCAENTELTGADGLRCILKPGDSIMISVTGIHTDPLYWEQPDEFRPERFDKTSEEYRRRHRYVYLPFGEGPRKCPGVRSGLLQVKSVIVGILNNFIIEKSPRLKEPIEVNPLDFFPSIKGGAWIRLKPLSNSLNEDS